MLQLLRLLLLMLPLLLLLLLLLTFLNFSSTIFGNHPTHSLEAFYGRQLGAAAYGRRRSGATPLLTRPLSM